MSVGATGFSSAGNITTLTCSASLMQSLRGTLIINLMKTDGTKIENGTLVDVSVSELMLSTFTLTFNPLHSSHGDQYLCVASMNISGADVYLSGSGSYNITVQS